MMPFRIQCYSPGNLEHSTPLAHVCSLASGLSVPMEKGGDPPTTLGTDFAPDFVYPTEEHLWVLVSY